MFDKSCMRFSLAAVLACVAICLHGCGDEPKPSPSPSPPVRSIVVEKVNIDLTDVCSGPPSRTAWLHFGADLRSDAEGLVVSMHGHTHTAEEMVNISGDKDCELHTGKFCSFSELAVAKKLMVVYPQGYGKSWNGGPGCCEPVPGYPRLNMTIDDTCFIQHLAEKIKSSHLSIKHVFAMGQSNGGVMSWRLACELPAGYFTAIAPIHGVMGGSTHMRCNEAVNNSMMNSTVRSPGYACPAAQAVPTLTWTGDKDSVQTWTEVVASAELFRSMFSKQFGDYQHTPEVSFNHQAPGTRRFVECQGTAASSGAGNVTVCVQHDPERSGCAQPSNSGCASHRYPDGSCEDDSHASSLVIEFFLSQAKFRSLLPVEVAI